MKLTSVTSQLQKFNSQNGHDEGASHFDGGQQAPMQMQQQAGFHQRHHSLGFDGRMAQIENPQQQQHHNHQHARLVSSHSNSSMLKPQRTPNLSLRGRQAQPMLQAFQPNETSLFL